MIISIGHLRHGDLQDSITWLAQNVGERKYYLHTQSGGMGWRYYNNDRTVEIEDPHLATMFILKFGS